MRFKAGDVVRVKTVRELKNSADYVNSEGELCFIDGVGDEVICTAEMLEYSGRLLVVDYWWSGCYKVKDLQGSCIQYLWTGDMLKRARIQAEEIFE